MSNVVSKIGNVLNPANLISNVTGGMVGGGGPTAPTPDFTGAVNAQGAANTDAARLQGHLNNPNIVDPSGSQTVTWQGDTPTVTRSLSPDQQNIYNLNNQISQQMGQLGVQQTGRVADQMGQGFDTSQMPGRVSSVQTPNLQTGVDMNTNFQGAVQPGQMQNQINTSGMPTPNFDYARGQVQGSVAGAGDAARNAVEQAMYSRSTARLDPRYQQSDDNLRSNLVAQGLHEGTTAWDRAWQNQNMAKNDAYSSAMNDAITAGGAEQSRQFGMNLQTGQFGNAAQAQDASQNLAAANLGNQAQQQDFGQRQAEGTFANAAQGQDFNQQAANTGLVNQALLARNTATLQGAQFQNQAGEQQFNENTQNANLSNAQRQQAMQEQAFLRQLPLQELNALRTGTQVTQPQFQNFAGAGNVQAAPVFAGAQAANQNQLDLYNAKIGQQNAFIGGAGQAGAAAIPFMLSDMRLKKNIKQLGTLPSGLPFYEFEYLWSDEKEVGVMAQEVIKIFPEAIHWVHGGYMAVDYRRIS